MYRKFRNVPILKDFPSICPYFLGFRVGKYATAPKYARDKKNCYHNFAIFLLKIGILTELL